MQLIPDAKTKSTETAVRISGDRVLTSNKCVTILKEREEKRKQQDEEKERKKIEREQKRRTKERRTEKKEDSIAAERKALAAEKKALVTAKNAERESRNSTGQTDQQRGRKRNSENEPSLVEKFLRVSTDEGATSCVNTITENSPDVATHESNNTCCVCFASFQGDDEIGCNVLAQGGCMRTA